MDGRENIILNILNVFPVFKQLLCLVWDLG